MFSYLKGLILHQDEQNLIVVNNDIGYHVQVPKQILDNHHLNQTIELFLHTHVREDILALYGFSSLAELNFFKLLLTVSGIGPRSALEIMSHATDTIINAILSNDVARLTQISGIGKKTAERLILELKNKVEPSLSFTQNKGSLPTSVNEDVIAALTSLGYSRYQVLNVLKNLEKNLSKTEDIVRFFLKNV